MSQAVTQDNIFKLLNGYEGRMARIEEGMRGISSGGPGTQGPAGPQGPQGAQGAAAYSARVTRNAALTVAHGTNTSVPFTTETWDDDNIFDLAAPTRLTCRHAGTYVITAVALWNSSPAGSYRQARIILNGVTEIAQVTGGVNVGGSRLEVAQIYKLIVGDYLELSVAQDTGGGLDIFADGARFAMASTDGAQGPQGSQGAQGQGSKSFAFFMG